jgi:hypothetical protein
MRRTRSVSVALAVLLWPCLAAACLRGPNEARAPLAPATAAAGASAFPAAARTTAPATASAVSGTAAATALATPIAGASLQVGSWTVAVNHFQAQVSDPDGVNVRSSPEVTADNRTGSLPSGATVNVEGTVANGQEAVAGQGTTWYYVGTIGTATPTPQFIYGAPGTLTPLTGAATPVAAGTPAATATAATTATPAATP